MKKIHLLFAGLVFIVSSQAQKFSKPLQSLIDAEISFAKLAKETDVKNAFLNYMAIDGIKFQNGEVVNALKAFDTIPAPKDLLIWEPVYADISSSEELGYTTGPSISFKGKTDTVPVGIGYYATIWAKQKNGQWKVMLDMGTGFKEPEKVKPLLSTSQIKLEKEKISMDIEKSLSELLEFDRSYIQELNISHRSFNSSYLSAEVRMHRPREQPFVGFEKVTTINESDKSFSMNQIGGGIADSGDFGYTYGKVNIELSVNGKTQTISRFFLRVWKKENGKNWKDVFDVIGQ